MNEGIPERSKEAIFAAGSCITAIGFWGIVIEGALNYTVNRPSASIDSATVVAFGLFSGLFVVGLTVMAVSAFYRRRRTMS